MAAVLAFAFVLSYPMLTMKKSLSLLAALLLAACASQPVSMTPPAAAASAGQTVNVKLIAFNDFHGNLRTPMLGVSQPDPLNPEKSVTIAAGGAPYLAQLIQSLKAKNPNNVVVSVGDLIGASPLLSALFHDEPTIEAMNAMGLEFNAVGNHEFDKGASELLRMQRGGCHPKDGCQQGQFGGAQFSFLAANVIDEQTGTPLFPAYGIKRFEGIPVAFIGMTLKGTPLIVNRAGIAGLRFQDEATTVNALVPELKAQGVRAIVVVLHEGGIQTGEGGINDCKGISGAIVDIVKRLDPEVDAVVTGHTHQPYNCELNGKRVTSAFSYGRLLTEIDLQLDRRTGDVVHTDAKNLIVRAEGAGDATQQALINRYAAGATALEQRVIGKVPSWLATRRADVNGISPLGRLIADAQLAAMQGTKYGNAEIAVTNIGGIRVDLNPDANSLVTYNQLFTAQPFNNVLVTQSLSGAELVELLEQQISDDGKQLALQHSASLFYRWSAKRPKGSRVEVASIRINGQPIDLKRDYRLASSSYLANGSDGMTVMAKGRNVVSGPVEIDALVDFIAAGKPETISHADRALRVD